MKKPVMIDLYLLDRRLDFWLDKIQDCYKKEIESSMNQLRKEVGLRIK